MKGTLIGAVAGFLFKKHKDNTKDNTAEDVKLDSSVQGHLEDLQKHVAQQQKNTQETISKMSPEDQKDLAEKAKKWEL